MAKEYHPDKNPEGRVRYLLFFDYESLDFVLKFIWVLLTLKYVNIFSLKKLKPKNIYI